MQEGFDSNDDFSLSEEEHHCDDDDFMKQITPNGEASKGGTQYVKNMK